MRQITTSVDASSPKPKHTLIEDPKELKAYLAATRRVVC